VVHYYNECNEVETIKASNKKGTNLLVCNAYLHDSSSEEELEPRTDAIKAYINIITVEEEDSDVSMEMDIGTDEEMAEEPEDNSDDYEEANELTSMRAFLSGKKTLCVLYKTNWAYQQWMCSQTRNYSITFGMQNVPEHHTVILGRL